MCSQHTGKELLGAGSLRDEEGHGVAGVALGRCDEGIWGTRSKNRGRRKGFRELASESPRWLGPAAPPRRIPAPPPLHTPTPALPWARHALGAPLLSHFPSGNAASGFPADLQVPVNKVLQRRRLVRSPRPAPAPQSSSQGEAALRRRSPRPPSSRGAFPSAFPAHGAMRVFSPIGTPPQLGVALPRARLVQESRFPVRALGTGSGGPRGGVAAVSPRPSPAPSPISDTPFTASPEDR